MAKPKSSTLFHFTRSSDSLCGILRNGFFPRYSIEDIEWLEPSVPRIAIPIVCFCDIPLSRLADHVGFYGSYGLGLKKEWGIANGLNPLAYVSPSSTYASHFGGIWAELVKSKGEVSKSYFDRIFSMAAFHKPLSGEMVVAGKPVEKDFYQESEWRYVAEPDDNKLLFKEEFDDPAKLSAANDHVSKSFPLKVSPSDIRYIFVKNDSDIPSVVNFINTELDHFSSSDLKILVSRITSLESIDPDL